MANASNFISDADRTVQSRLLMGVSRTFALTIPQLPDQLQTAVGNGYLLCRIADTIEDDPGIGFDEKRSLYEHFLQVLEQRADVESFARRFASKLSPQGHPAERELAERTPTVVRMTHALSTNQQRAILRCVSIMCSGMVEFQARKSLDGLDSVADMNRYCYVVAGVVGEMLTDLFCDHSPAIEQQRDALMDLAICFGQGLQMTNILKDIWEDRRAGSCWLPRSVFDDDDRNLDKLMDAADSERLARGIGDLVGIAHANLEAALAYNRLIPKAEVGIRRFCLWAIGMAILTLQRIYRNPGFATARQVKIARWQVWAVVLSSSSIIFSNRLLRAWFELGSLGLPRSRGNALCDPARLRGPALPGPVEYRD